MIRAIKRPLERPEDADLSYFNARVRGMRASLLRQADYEPLMRLPDVDALAERLKATRYGTYIDASGASHKDRLEALTKALLAELAATLGFLWRIAPEGTRPLLKAMYSHWEVHDLKALIRGIARGVRREEIKATLIPAGEFDAASLDALLTAKDLPDLVRFLETWASPYASVLRPGLVEFKRSARVIEMELRADLVTNAMQLEALASNAAGSRIMKDWLRMKADLHNCLTLFKIAGEGYGAEAASGFFMEGGRDLTKERFARLSGLKDREELVGALAAVGGSSVKKALEFSGSDPALFEEAAEDAMSARFRTLSIVDPLSIALPASFIYMKIREIKNLRLIARGLAFGVPLDELRLFIFYPV